MDKLANSIIFSNDLGKISLEVKIMGGYGSGRNGLKELTSRMLALGTF